MQRKDPTFSARGLYKPTFKQFRKTHGIELFRNLETNMVLIKLRTSADARDEISNALIKKFPEANLKVLPEGEFNIPVINLTIPRDKVRSVLETVSNLENKEYKIEEANIVQLLDQISDTAVKPIFGNK